jgi:hypothetical protein
MEDGPGKNHSLQMLLLATFEHKEADGARASIEALAEEERHRQKANLSVPLFALRSLRRNRNNWSGTVLVSYEAYVSWFIWIATEGHAEPAPHSSQKQYWQNGLVDDRNSDRPNLPPDQRER